jgi:hypothetical protein
MTPHGATRDPIIIPVFAFGYAVGIRLVYSVTSRRSNERICFCIHPRACPWYSAKADKKAGPQLTLLPMFVKWWMCLSITRLKVFD